MQETYQYKGKALLPLPDGRRIFTYMRYSAFLQENVPIDLVYTWVNGNDPDYISYRNQFCPDEKQQNPERYRDIYETLRYSMRSAHTYLPWIRHIYLVTQRPQVPDWLDTTHPKITVVHHDQIFEHPRHLPCFNSNPIESHLHRIAGLSEAFIYMNDDHLLGQSIARTDFFTDDGRVRIFGTLMGENFAYRRYEVKNEFIGIGFTDHLPMLLIKERWAEGLQAWPELTEQTRMRKFREPDDLCMHRAYRYIMLKNHADEARAERFWEVLRKSRFHKIKPGFKRQVAELQALATHPPKFICLNDDLGPEPDERVVQEVRRFLDARWPEPAPWEKLSV